MNDTVRLQQLIDSGRAELQTGPFGTQLLASSYVESGTPVVAVRNIADNRLNVAGIPRIGEEDSERLSRYRLKKGDILFGRKGAVDRRALISADQEGWIQGSDCIRLRFDESVDSRFVSYLLGTNRLKRWLLQHAHGATMPSLNQQILGALPLSLPPLPEQRRIAHILGTLDDKIEINRQLNRTLDEIARTLFRSWFVDFDPVRAKMEGRQPMGMDAATAALFPDRLVDSELGPIPEGWEVKPISEMVNLLRQTVTPKNYPDEVFDHYSLPSFDNGATPKPECGSEISSNKTLLTEGVVLLSKLNPHIPRIWLPSVGDGVRSIASTEFLTLQPNDGISKEFLYSLVSSDSFQAEYRQRVSGTTGSHQRISPASFLSIPCVSPSNDLLIAYQEKLKSAFDLIQSNINENRTLAELRDTLLPELLSGRLRPDGVGNGS